jgi:protocatechuate 3,4-dioxygenase beta subunit
MSTSKFISRRNLLKTIGALSVVSINSGCGDKETDTSMSAEPSGEPSGEPSSETGEPTDTTEEGGTTADGWLIGGTALMTAAYPDDSIFDNGGNCEINLMTATTKGPCYFQDSTGEDISEGFTGLPMQLCLRLIDSNCNPLADHTIEVWHCDANGVYSGDTSESEDAANFSSGFCTGGDEGALRSSWYRGQLVTDVNGRVNFKSCFPGWYPGRTIHIHFAVSDANQTSRVVSQFCFPNELAAQVYTTHPTYSPRGDQDTPLERDGVFPTNTDVFMMSIRQNEDGSLLAYHTIQVN